MQGEGAAGDEQQLVVRARSQEPDLVITDINMPDMDGIELIRALRGREPPLPVVVMSGGGTFDKRLLLDSARMLGAVVALEKPFSLDELKRVVEDSLAS